MNKPNQQALSLCWGSMENIDLDEHIVAAAKAGFQAITTSPGAYAKANRKGYDNQAIKKLLAENDVSISGFDPVLSWIDGAPTLEGDADFAIATRTSLEQCIDIAAALDCPLINLPPGLVDADNETLIKNFRRACDMAAEKNIIVSLEFLPFAKTNNLAAAWHIIESAGASNGGIMLDIWHFYQSGGQLEDFYKIDINRLIGLQLNGAKQCTPDQWIDQTMNARLQANEGDCDVAAIVHHLRKQGLDIIYDIEIFSEALRALPAAQRAKQCYDATHAMLENT